MTSVVSIGPLRARDSRFYTQTFYDEKSSDEEVAPPPEKVVLKEGSTLAVGSTELYDENGGLRLIPMPSPDPKDPLNMPNWRKWTAVGVLCFFGSLALSAEVVIGGLLPIFLLEYAGLDPTIIKDVNFVQQSGGSAVTLNPLAVIPQGVQPPDLGKVTLLATVPLLANGISSYFLVPLSIAVGRRPVLLATGALAWAGGLMAGLSTSLDAHLAARVLQGLGAGAVEALIPLIVQDMVFIHQRNKAQSAIVSSQGIIIIGLGISAPWVAANYSWRWLYFITSGFGILAWFLLIAFLPETRWTRTKEELSGQKVYSLQPGQKRPELDFSTFSPRTLWTNVGLFQFGFEFKNAGRSMLDTLRTTLLPAVLWAVAANSVFIIANQAAQQLSSFALLAQGWQFQYTGLSVVPFIAASGLVYILAGPVADRVSNAVTRRHDGIREPEHHLPNFILPFVSGVAGAFIFGWAGENNAHWSVLLVGSFLIIFAFLTTMTLVNVYIVESYPMWAGPVLVNVSSLRLIIAFFLASKTTEWVVEKGLLGTMAIYAEVMIVVSLGIPALYMGGKKVRGWTGGSVRGTTEQKVMDVDMI